MSGEKQEKSKVQKMIQESENVITIDKDNIHNFPWELEVVMDDHYQYAINNLFANFNQNSTSITIIIKFEYPADWQANHFIAALSDKLNEEEKQYQIVLSDKLSDISKQSWKRSLDAHFGSDDDIKVGIKIEEPIKPRVPSLQDLATEKVMEQHVETCASFFRGLPKKIRTSILESMKKNLISNIEKKLESEDVLNPSDNNNDNNNNIVLR